MSQRNRNFKVKPKYITAKNANQASLFRYGVFWGVYRIHSNVDSVTVIPYPSAPMNMINIESLADEFYSGNFNGKGIFVVFF